MSHINTKQRKHLEGQFGDRVRFDKTERIMYSHDIAAMPSLVKPLIGNTIPDAVIQPKMKQNWPFY